jgi:hypothetical protein
MGEKRTFIMAHDEARRRAAHMCGEVPQGWAVTFSEPTRNLEQNAALWSLLAEIAEQVVWYGQKLTSNEWKDVLTASLKQQKVVPGIDGGFVVCGASTSKMGKREFSDLLELGHAFAAQQGVKLSINNA